MKRFIHIIVVLAALPCLNAEESGKLILVHYMPWYTSKPVTGSWGWHWTMNHFNPDQTNATGRIELASHDRPLIGPYDSNDPDVLECQVLQMKLTGIDGVIIDWNGIRDHHDYGMIHRNTQHLITYVKKAGMKFAICYEDQSIGELVKGKKVKEDEIVSHGREVMQWLQKHAFQDEAYVKLDGQAILLIFGPRYLSKEQWTAIVKDQPQAPRCFALPHLNQAAGIEGVFGWPPVHGGEEVKPESWNAYLDDLYKRTSVIATAFPGFHDMYKEAGLHDSYGFIDARDGKTFTETLERAWESDAPIIQIATWNDYGEGTMIEPTVDQGYAYLERLQAWVKERKGKAFTKADLKLPSTLYTMRKQSQNDPSNRARIEAMSAAIFQGDTERARRKGLDLLSPTD